jgi:tetratricopeptide (TPR) repeat protein
MNAFQQSHQAVLKLFILIFLGITLYAQTFNDPFHFDDTVTIVGNKAVHYLPDWPLTVREILIFQPSRFVTNVTFALNYYFNRLDVFGYHLVNLIGHLTATVLVWWLGELLLQLQIRMRTEKELPHSGKKKSAAKKKSEIKTVASVNPDAVIPFLAALLFLVHPVNTESVAYISQRSESLAALFYVASVCLYIKGRADGKKSVFYFLAAIFSGLLATFSKETAVTLPLMIILIEMFFFRRGQAAVGRLRHEWFLVLLFVVLVPSAFHFNYKKMLFVSYLSQSHLGDVLTLPTYLLTQLNVFVTFLRLMFVPVGLNLDHDYPMAHSLFEPSILFSFCLLAGLLLAAFRFRREHPLLAFAVFWFFLTLSSNLVPRAHVMFEHKLYLALTGTLPALSLGLGPNFKNTRSLMFGLCIVIVLFWGMAFARNRVWDSDVSLWEDVIRKSPQKARVQLSMGAAYAMENRYDGALKFLTQSISMTADPYRAYLNRGAVYVKMKNDDLALKDFDLAIAANPQFLDAYINRGEVFARRKDYPAALSDFNKTIEVDPNYAPGYKMRGRVYDALQKYPQALADYNRALSIDPGDAQVLAWRGYIDAIGGHFDEALVDFNAALRLDPKFSDAYVYRGMYYKDRRDYQRAFTDLNKAIVLNPSSSLAHYQQASVWFDAGNLNEASKDLERAIALDPGFDLPHALRGIIHARRKEYGQALAELTKAIALNPQSGSHYFNRSRVYKEQGDKVNALKDAQAARATGFSVNDSYLNGLH